MTDERIRSSSEESASPILNKLALAGGATMRTAPPLPPSQNSAGEQVRAQHRTCEPSKQNWPPRSGRYAEDNLCIPKDSGRGGPSAASDPRVHIFETGPRSGRYDEDS
jgi:hypothetical protein